MRSLSKLTNATWVLIFVSSSFVTIAHADVFNDRVYHFGDDLFEAGSVGAVLGANIPAPFNDGRTIDSMGTGGVGDFQDLFRETSNPNNAPVYVDTMASGRPGATVSDRLGAHFDGDGDSLRGRELNSPNNTWQDLINDNSSYPNNWTDIFNRGMQLWVRPEASAGMDMAGIGGGLRQDVVTDTGEHGIFISGNDNWGLQFDDTSVESSTLAIAGEWTHVMQRTLSGALGGALFVNGVAVAARGTFYDPEDGDMSVGGNQDLTGNYFKGELDELTMFVWGDNSNITPLPGEPAGMNWGQLDMAQDNEWIQQELTTLGITDPADVNLDSQVNNDDVIVFVDGWRSENLVNDVPVGDWISRQAGDLNYDGIVDLDDAFLLHEGLLAATGQGLNFDLLIPEPSSSALLVFAVLGFISCRSRRDKKTFLTDTSM